MVLAAIVTFNPIGLAFLKSAFLAEEALARNIARPIVLSGAGIVGLAAVLEWLIRAFVMKSRGRGNTTA